MPVAHHGASGVPDLPLEAHRRLTDFARAARQVHQLQKTNW